MVQWKPRPNRCIRSAGTLFTNRQPDRHTDRQTNTNTQRDKPQWKHSPSTISWRCKIPRSMQRTLTPSCLWHNAVKIAIKTYLQPKVLLTSYRKYSEKLMYFDMFHDFVQLSCVHNKSTFVKRSMKGCRYK